jgi:hypothetical protein
MANVPHMKNAGSSLEEALANDPRPPVLYLRSFRDLSEEVLIRSALSPVPAEWIIVESLARIGPCISIGKPGENPPERGAATLQLSDDEWQSRVGELLNRATLVVLKVGNTERFWWETQQVLTMLPPEKVLFVLGATTSPQPPANAEGSYLAFRSRVEKMLPKPLPTKLGKACFLAFGPGWEPMLLGEVGRLWQAGYFRQPSYIDEGLSPVLRRFGVEIEKPRMISRGVWKIVIAGIILMVAASLWARFG